MNILYASLTIIIASLLAYLFGSASTSIIVGKLFFNKDIRLHGSKNAGGTNAGRVLGKKAGVFVMIIDLAKAVTVFWLLAWLFTSIDFASFTFDWVPLVTIYLSLLALSLGHCWPIFFQFKGGKTVSIFAGIILSMNWLLVVIGFPAFMLVIKITKKVSLASLTIATSLTVLSWLYLIPALNGFGFYPLVTSLPFFSPLATAILLTIVLVELIGRHRSNIKRLLANTENEVTWAK